MSYIREGNLDETNYPLFAAIKHKYGFIPNLYRAQSLRPDLLEAQAQLVNAVVVKEGALPRKQKEYIFLVCSAANLSTYCVTAHCEMIRMMGIEGPEPEQIALDYTRTDLPITVKALLHFALKLTAEPTRISSADVDALRTYGYSDEQIHETVALVGVAKYANFMAFGLGTLPDFDSSRIQLPTKEAASAGSPVL
jgi:uncharacterized peroxidase-related enzyme